MKFLLLYLVLLPFFWSEDPSLDDISVAEQPSDAVALVRSAEPAVPVIPPRSASDSLRFTSADAGSETSKGLIPSKDTVSFINFSGVQQTSERGKDSGGTCYGIVHLTLVYYERIAKALRLKAKPKVVASFQSLETLNPYARPEQAQDGVLFLLAKDQSGPLVSVQDRMLAKPEDFDLQKISRRHDMTARFAAAYHQLDQLRLGSLKITGKDQAVTSRIWQDIEARTESHGGVLLALDLYDMRGGSTFKKHLWGHAMLIYRLTKTKVTVQNGESIDVTRIEFIDPNHKYEAGKGNPDYILYFPSLGRMAFSASFQKDYNFGGGGFLNPQESVLSYWDFYDAHANQAKVEAQKKADNFRVISVNGRSQADYGNSGPDRTSSDTTISLNDARNPSAPVPSPGVTEPQAESSTPSNPFIQDSGHDKPIPAEKADEEESKGFFGSIFSAIGNFFKGIFSIFSGK